MFDAINNAAASTKKFVSDHSTALAVGATVIIAGALHVKVVGQHNDFLKEHDLFDEFYALEED